MQQDDHLSALFAPSSVAVVGASATRGKAGYAVVANMLAAGYRGKILPVNPAHEQIQGIDCHASLDKLPEKPDLAVICLPREQAAEALEQAARAGARAAVVTAGGFREVGPDGHRMERELARLAEQHGIALLGPNSVGVINTHLGLNATIASGDPPGAGRIGFFSQSGALCLALLDWASGEDIGFSTFVGLGNQAVIADHHVLAHMGADPQTSVILGYAEAMEDGDTFMETASRVTVNKPVIMLKSGTTGAGARAASSHTGVMAGDPHASHCAFLQSGVIQVQDLRTLFTLARAFATQPLPAGPNLSVVTNSGGPGILAADATEKSELNLVRPGEACLARLRELLPPFASLYNPIDIIGDADAERYRVTLEAVARDEQAHAILVVLSPTASVEIEATAQAVIDVAKTTDKPVFACFMGGERIGPGRDMLLEAGIPCYAYPEPAIHALEAMYKHMRWREKPYPVDVCFRRDLPRAKDIVANARRMRLNELPEQDALDVARAFELPMPEGAFARTADQAVRRAKKIGYPVALKVVSPGIASLREVGGVALGLETPQEVRRAFLTITNNALRAVPGTYLAGCLVQAMAPANSIEARAGFRRDPQYGPLLFFSLAGAQAEVLGDVAYRLAPLSFNNAHEMLRELVTFPLLRGARGGQSVDLRALEDILLTISQIAVDLGEVQEALFEPILASAEGALVIDARMTIG